MVTLCGFTILVFFLAIQRLFELFISNRNELWIREQGGYELFPEHYQQMVFLHISWFVAMLIEAWSFHGVPNFWLQILGINGFLMGQIFRYLAIKKLGKRWSTRIFVIPNHPLIKSGIYKYFKHPNYLGVILEIAFIPLIYSAFATSIIWSIANIFILRHRIRLEEKVLKGN